MRLLAAILLRRGTDRRDLARLHRRTARRIPLLALCTALLREEWGYTGNVMTDWWMRYAASPEFPELRDNGYRVRAQVDVLMPGAKTAISKSAPNDGSLLATLGKPDGITLGELQRTAKNVLRMTLRTKFAGQYKD